MTLQDQTIIIRSAVAADDWAVYRLFSALHTFNAELDPYFMLADGWERVLNEHLAYVRSTGHGMTLLAWQGYEPVGLLMMGTHSDSPLFRHRHWAELLAIYVAPVARNGQLAQQLLQSGIAWAQEKGYERIQLYVTVSNKRARQFYTRSGFQPVQEIWRRNIGPSSIPPPDDPVWEAIYARDQDLLTPNAHQLLIDEPDHAGNNTGTSECPGSDTRQQPSRDGDRMDSGYD